MKAAVIDQFGATPRYADFADPVAQDGEVVVEVVASGLHQLVRGQASGQHYSSGGDLPQVPGADGVARLADGSHAWFAQPRKPFGTLAERTPVAAGRWIPLPAGADPAVVAGQVNPTMSSWLALTVRTRLQPGQTVLVLGATGTSGRQAVQIAKHLGAGRVIAVGRNPGSLAELTELGADRLVRLGDDGSPLDPIDEPVDVVLDYLWANPMLGVMSALLAGQQDPARPLTLVQLGSMAGRTAELPANALRSRNLSLIGSGIGSIPAAAMFAELTRLIAEIAAGTFACDVRSVPLSEIAQAWTSPAAPGERIVFLP